MTKELKTGLKIDALIQGLTLLGIACTFIGGLLIGYEFFIIAAWGLMPLGVLQVSSAIMFGLLLKDYKRRGLYLLSVFGFFLSIFFVHNTELGLFLNQDLFSGFALFIMGILAIRCFSITMQDMIAANTPIIQFKIK